MIYLIGGVFGVLCVIASILYITYLKRDNPGNARSKEDRKAYKQALTAEERDTQIVVKEDVLEISIYMGVKNPVLLDVVHWTKGRGVYQKYNKKINGDLIKRQTRNRKKRLI